MTTTDRWPTLRIMLTGHVAFALIIWLLFAVVSALVTAGFAIFGTVTTSIWYTVGTQVPRWFLLGLGVDAITTYLRLHIAHGRTRKEFLRQVFPYALVLSTVSALFSAVGYLLERALYAANGWPPRLPDGLVFADTTAFFAIFGVYTVVFLLWTVVGVMLGAAFVRNVLLGVVSIPLALLVVLPGELLLRINGLPLLADLSERWAPTLVANLGLAAGTLVLAGTVVWAISRDMPLRPKVA